MTQHPASGAQRRKLLARLLPGAALLALAAGCDRHGTPAFQSTDVTGAEWGRDFRLMDADGQPRTLADYRGKLVLLFFGFTQCPDICPTALSRAVAIKGLLRDDGAKLQVLFVTIDPERDAPPVLREYMRAFDPSFIGLWGDAETTRIAARDFKAYYKKVPTGSSYTMDHSTISYVFDTAGHLRLAVRHEQTAASVAADLKRLLQEAVS